MQVAEARRVADPPLMRVENEAGHAYLSMLLHLQSAGGASLQEAASILLRLLELCIENLQAFQVGHRAVLAASRHHVLSLLHRMHALSS